MKLVWTRRALNDLVHLHAFLTPVNPDAAAKAVQNLVATADRLRHFPRIGERLDRYDPSEVRRIFAGPYEIRYSLTTDSIFILSLWHGRERR